MEEKNNLENSQEGVIELLKNVMSIATRTQKTIKTMIDFIDQKGLLQEFEAFALERFNQDQAEISEGKG